MQKRTKFQIRSDAAKQRWVRDDKKEAFWRKHVDAWKQSRLSKRAFCIAHNLSQSSFNAWRRELELRDRENQPSANAAELLTTDQHTVKAFVPIRLVQDDPLEQKEISSDPGQPEVLDKQIIVEVLVPGGAVLRFDENCPASFVSKLFAALKEI